MSAASDTYDCHICTFIQSKKRPTCEMCQAPNPFFISENFESDTDVISRILASPFDDDIVVCRQCHQINFSRDDRICRGCQHPLSTIIRSLESSDGDEDDDDDDDGSNVASARLDSPPVTTTVTVVDPPIKDEQLVQYFNRFLLVTRDQRSKRSAFANEQLHRYIMNLYSVLEFTASPARGSLQSAICQICYEGQSMVTMKTCGHRVICADDFHQYLMSRIRSGDILPWIPCPAKSCTVPCHADNIIHDGGLIYADLLAFLTTYMLKKLFRNENFIPCRDCQKAGFLQIGVPRKQTVQCFVCNAKQTIEKGSDGHLDAAFKLMIGAGELRPCPTCRHWTMKEKGICNVIECVKCGIWWNWNTREQGHNGPIMKQQARSDGTLWEPGELQYQLQLQNSNPEEFKALLERNGIKYDPHYIRGGRGQRRPTDGFF